MAFTPLESSIGGMMIGLAAAMAYVIHGKIAGISGIVGPSLREASQCQSPTENQVWRLLFLLGLVLGGLANLVANPTMAFPTAFAFSPLRYVLGGFCTGIGTRMGKGCTSGHGICGLPRFSLRSWIAVPTFMGTAVATVILCRHVFKVDPASPWAIAELQSPSWQFPVAALGASLVFAACAVWSPTKAQAHFTPLAAGTIFGLGLGISGMTSQSKVLDFLDVGGTWDPSLAFVMGGGICVSFPAFFWAEKPEVKPLCATKDFERPPKYGNYGDLVTGAVFFGLGWGLIGICPGPAIAGAIPYLTQGLPGLNFAAGFICMCVAWLATDKLLQIREARKQKHANRVEGF
mmetsp:Transcript_79804/g.140860  ORF Transcript_79804/g.140860 Transcript_79804/m.140860 type:complete len:347 (-) Transcript_79804:114-1154(-)|eukprot:CAMPEP_0197629190 /NCGR_PEP_ID=MMETSP1338-20131121/7151_1 /TAXON_ID=43686 ORGANISM="Pelagodinium beii, Strain RCC1491" /NCGR_SAMPLE_ID=MMETSP1338 /ASSEMBLY_ACC=CAM_ASM_000754 /LENGTH=346 /DNA_ID=CAMNT_0043200213 /DNA_START=63 /DNA_END=1103 /DNA_ORIENTATION=+